MDALLSIKPKWASLILEGKKTVELRKQWTKSDDIERIYLYASSPVKKIVGWIELDRAVCEDVEGLKRDTEHFSQVPSKDFDAYYQGKATGWGLFIRNAVKIKPVPLDAVAKRPPQSWMRLFKEQSEALEQWTKVDLECR